MTISPLECLNALEAQGVRIYLTDDRLQIVAPKNVLTEEHREILRGGRDEIIEFIRNRRTARVPDGPGPVVPVDRDGALPLSFGQQRLWFLAQLEPDSVEYNTPMAVRLGGPLDTAALSGALGALVERHEVLRTRLVAGGDGVPYQVIDPAPPTFELPTVDMTGEADPVAAAREWLARDAALPFDLAAGPGFRATLVRLGVDDHVLSLARHHVVSDESSARILRRELPLLYASARRGEPSPLEPLPVQYADFAVWQREWLTGEVLERHLDYWRDRLAGAPVSELPADRPRPPVRSSAGALIEFEVPPRVTDGLRAVARSGGATMFMTLLAALNVLMSRYSGQNDIVVGAPVANRDRAEIEGLIGFFINTLVLRTDLSGDPTYAELLARVRSGALEAYEHRDLPFEHLVDALEIERDLSRNPVCQVLFNYVSGEEAGPAPAGEDRDAAGEATFDFDPRSVFGEVGGGPASTSAKADLELTLAEAGGGLAGALEYSTALFDRSTIRRLVGHLLGLLESVAADADRHVSLLPVLTAGERRQLEGWNDTASALPAVGGVHELVVERASSTPAAPAVVCGDASLTYRELDTRANRLARYLRGAGVGAETVVGLCLERGVDRVVALLAVWKAGGAYLPLDPEYPADRLAFMLADGGVSVLVGSSSAVEDLPAGRIRGVILDDPAVAAGVAAQDGSPLVVGVLPDQMAYVMYTSGSTGRPKGVQVPHRGVVNLALAQAEVFGVGAGDRALQFASFGFDAAVSEVCVALAAGACVVMADAVERSEADRLASLVRRTSVDVATLPPSLLGALSAGDLTGLRTLVAAGEALGTATAGAWGARHRLLNAYGPTETTVCASVSEPVDPGSSGAPPIGRPIANTRVLVLDAALNLAPVGVPGEVFVGGVGLARGYRRRPELTAERFVADPYAADGSRLYRTGDVARRRADGQLEFVGRVDEQLKVRGFRVEPGEIETTLTAHPGVRQAVVVADEDRRLVAYAVPCDPAEGIPPAGELRSLLRDRLPEYMVPGVFVELAALPLSPNGKVDRAALPAPDGTRPELTEGFATPRTAAEELLAGIWGEVLGLDRIGVHDDFFELGGHSLLATRVVSRVRAAFAVDVPLAALFNAPTVAGLAEVIDGLAGSAGRPAEPAIVPVDRALPLPLSFSQQRLWFLAQLEPESVEYNTPMPVRLSGEVDAEALRAALSALVERHEVLRTRLVADPDGVAHQVVDPPAPVPLPMVDVSGADDPTRAVDEWIERDLAMPFDLATGPLFRATLVRIAEREHVLALAMHHVVSDEWSEAILRRELDALYEAFRGGRPSPLAPLPVQYADFAVWQRQWLTGDVIDGHLAFWRERLADVPVLDLPTDRPRPPVRSSAGAAVDFAVPEPVARRLRTLSRDAGATMFMTLLGVFDVLLARYAGQDDIVVGTPIANRTRAEIEGLAGCFINTLVLRTDLSGDPAFTELLARVRAGALDAYAHQDLPFEQLVDELVTERDRSRTPVFQALFNYLTEEVTPPEEAADGRAQGGVTTRCDLRLIFAEVTGGGLLGTVQYSTALFDRSTVERLAEHLLELLEAVADDANRPLSRLSMVPVAERRRMAEWNDTATEMPAVGGVHELVAARAARCLDAVALVSGGDSLIYEDLEIAANRLACHLGEAGVGPETVVGLCLGPGVDVIVSMLAIWKAGGAYLPLDPAYPADRLAYMLADGGVSMLVGTLAAVDEIPVGRIRTVILDDPAVAAAVAAQSETAPRVTVSPDQVAYVIYTSGSTGRPKGVQVTHRGLVNYVTSVPGRVGLGGVGSRYALLQPAATDFGNTMIFSCLATGGTLHLVDPDVVTDPDEVSGYLTRHAIDYLKIVPSHLAALSSEYEPARLLPGRTLILGGEAAPRAWVSRLLEAAPGRAVFNHYGPTETTIGVATTRLDGDDTGSVPIGSPIANARLHVLDRHLDPVPFGVPGELYVGGACLARGYLNRPDLTGERFVADPFTADGSRLYRTGDKARWRADGRLEFLGRVDHQVKVRGFRVEPGEIEAQLTAHAAVGSAAVVADGQDEGRRLVAYLTPADAEYGVPATAELRRFLSRRLPDPMIPAAFVELSELPLTANGKLDRSALPAPDSVRPDPAETYVAPDTYQERLLAEIWADVLRLDRVGTTDDFFELGGHSLLVTQIVARVRATGHDISVGEFFEHPTVSRLAPLLRVRLDGTALQETRSAFQLRNGEVTPPLFLIHPASGSVTDFADIAGRLARGQQAYGLQSLGLLDGDLPLETIEEMAGAYLDDVRELQPEGPYLFAAWSMGCYVALEMARQVTEAGGEMGGLFLIGPPYRQERSADWIRMEWERASVLLRRVDETIDAGPGTRLPEDVEEYLLGSWDQDDDGVAAVRAGDNQRLRLGRALLTNFWAGVRYQDDQGRTGKAYDGRVVLFVPQDDLDERQRAMIEQWRRECVREPEIVPVPGKHRTVIYDDGAEAIGAALSEEIDRAAG